MPYHPSCCPLTHPSLSATVLPGCPRGARGPPAALERRGAAPLHADAGAEGGCSASGGGGRGIRCGGGGCCSGGRRGHCCTPRVRVLPGEGGGANPGTEPWGPCQDDIAGHDPITQGSPTITMSHSPATSHSWRHLSRLRTPHPFSSARLPPHRGAGGPLAPQRPPHHAARRQPPRVRPAQRQGVQLAAWVHVIVASHQSLSSAPVPPPPAHTPHTTP